MISIVIPAYNAEKFLPETLDSVLAQTLMDWELIVVDDGSCDGTGAVAEGYAARDSRVRVVHQANGGLPAARNRGLAESNPASRSVIFLDADDLWMPDTLSLLQGALDEQPESVAAHGMACFIDGQSRPIQPGRLERRIRRRKAIVGGRLVTWPVEKPTGFQVLVYDCMIITAGTVLIRRSALNTVCNFDTMRHLERASLEDWDLWLRLSLRGDITVVHKVILSYRKHENNLSKRSHLMFLGDVYVRRKLSSRSDLTESQREAAQKSNLLWAATKYRRVSASRFRAFNAHLRSGHVQEAATALRQCLRLYVNYLFLRHSRRAPPVFDLVEALDARYGVESEKQIVLRDEA